ncbi:MAG TPA: hypothetical protein VL443_24200 [Cyclobacteriaceae bacterium]|jgi:hypothetical protein|nr:hypothetical protein [Cyclobacteriaceae bacterium]
MDEFIKLAEEMRDAQKNYFKARRNHDDEKSQYYLALSKRLEGEFDAFILKYKKDKEQPKLF